MSLGGYGDEGGGECVCVCVCVCVREREREKGVTPRRELVKPVVCLSAGCQAVGDTKVYEP